MKVGLIFECGPEGADKIVCEHLACMLEPDIEIASVTLDNKAKLVRECGKAAALLLADSCERVVIIWDLYPPWRRGVRPCRKEDRNNIGRSLADAGVNSQNVYLVCIKEELEAWLLADDRAVCAVLSKPTFTANVSQIRHPERTRNPKKRLNQIFKQNGRPRYNDLTDAKRIVRALPDLNRLKRCATFVRFAIKVTGNVDILSR